MTPLEKLRVLKYRLDPFKNNMTYRIRKPQPNAGPTYAVHLVTAFDDITLHIELLETLQEPTLRAIAQRFHYHEDSKGYREYLNYILDIIKVLEKEKENETYDTVA